MKFHLQFPIAPFPEKINYRQQLLFMGSCFAESIGATMEKYKFNVLINPNGIIYNPSSISNSLRKYIANYKFDETDLFHANEVWNSWEHHSEYSFLEKEKTLTSINSAISEANKYLLKADWLFITFGSAYYYKRKDTEKLVANCHKQPQKEFTKHLLTVEEIVDDYTHLINDLKNINSKLKIVLTVSPVRYIRDGVVENSRSKARLLETVHQLSERNSNVYYFPAYEIVIDDLRDYRFFKEDLTHPNGIAINYIFEKWLETTFDKETELLFEKVKSIISDSNHRPLHPNTLSHNDFVTSYKLRAKQLQTEFPFIKLEEFN